MAVTMTEAARERVRVLRAAPDVQGEWLRMGVRGGGCSGLSYVLDFVPSPDEKDKVFDLGDGVKVCIDRKSYLFLNGLQIDFEASLAKTGFVFKNPNASSSCSCGESFTI